MTTEPSTGGIVLPDVISPEGERVLAELAADAPPIPVQDPVMHAAGCHLSALALLIPAGLVVAYNAYTEPTTVDVELVCRDALAAEAVAKHLEWSGPVLRSTEPASDTTLGTHRMWSGVVYRMRLRVAGLEPPQGGDES